MRILFFQYGNYAEAYLRLKDGGAETYRDQRDSVNYVAGLSGKDVVTTVAITEDTHDIALTPTLHSVGVRYDELTGDRIAQLFDDLDPDRLICRTPHWRVLLEARRRQVPTLPCFADIFSLSGLRPAYHALRLRRSLIGSHIQCVANHSLNASRSVPAALFFPRDKVVPWDWSRISVADEPKPGMSDPNAPTAFFAGTLSEAKGVGDCLEAVAHVRRQGIALSMAFAGPGDIPRWQMEAARLGIADAVTFLGQIAHHEVRERMRTHDVVVVPSRHSYPEGLPNTIYEALAARSALIISDHPAFRGRLIPDTQCLVFKAAQPVSLATCLERVCKETDLYAALSENASAASDGLYVGMLWEDLVGIFLEDPQNKTGWVQRNSLTGLGL